jgi:hypothetical protein
MILRDRQDYQHTNGPDGQFSHPISTADFPQGHPWEAWTADGMRVDRFAWNQTFVKILLGNLPRTETILEVRQVFLHLIFPALDSFGIPQLSLLGRNMETYYIDSFSWINTNMYIPEEEVEFARCIQVLEGIAVALGIVV